MDTRTSQELIQREIENQPARTLPHHYQYFLALQIEEQFPILRWINKGLNWLAGITDPAPVARSLASSAIISSFLTSNASLQNSAPAETQEVINDSEEDEPLNQPSLERQSSAEAHAQQCNDGNKDMPRPRML